MSLYGEFLKYLSMGEPVSKTKQGNKYNKIKYSTGYKRQKEHVKCPVCKCLVLRINEEGLCEDCGE